MVEKISASARAFLHWGQKQGQEQAYTSARLKNLILQVLFICHFLILNDSLWNPSVRVCVEGDLHSHQCLLSSSMQAMGLAVTLIFIPIRPLQGNTSASLLGCNNNVCHCHFGRRISWRLWLVNGPSAGSSRDGEAAMLEGLMDGKHDGGDDWRHVDTVSMGEGLVR